jgi:putative SOS response-associated peptidase YedK
MCGRFAQTPIREAASLGLPQLVGDLLSMPANYNLAPTQRATAVLDRGDGFLLQRFAQACRPSGRRRGCRSRPSMPAKSRRWPPSRRSARPSRSADA